MQSSHQLVLMSRASALRFTSLHFTSLRFASLCFALLCFTDALAGDIHTTTDSFSEVQVHEWGGVFTDIVTYSHFRQFRPGLRIAINSHGGHYWSTQVNP